MNMLARTNVLLSAVFAAAFGYCTVWAQAGAEEERVTIRSVVGKAEVKSAESPEWRPVRTDMAVKAGWDIRTFAESSLELQYESGTVVRIGENSVVTLMRITKETKTQPGNNAINLATGEIWANIRKLMRKKSSFSFETPTAVASIRGTVARAVTTGGKDTIECFAGSVEVTNKGSGRSVTITAQQRAVAEKGSSEINVETISKAATPWTVSKTVGNLTLTIDTPLSGTVANQSPIALKGITAAGATVAIGETKITAGDDGAFAFDVELVPGDNVATVTAAAEKDSASVTLPIVYRPKLTMTVTGVSDNMEVDADELAVEVDVPEGATYSLIINGQASESPLTLKPGKNVLTVIATSKWGALLEQEFTINCRKEALFLTVTSPADGSAVASSKVSVTGITVPAAAVIVNGVRAKADEMGNFIAKITLKGAGPDYAITVKAESEGKAASKKIAVKFAHKLDLQITNPQAGQKVDTTEISVAGTVTRGATVTVNGEKAEVKGTKFSRSVYMPDEAGEYEFEVVAKSRGDEITKKVAVFYEPKKLPIVLELQSPADGEVITASPVRVAGKTSPRAEVEMNGQKMIAGFDGRFSFDIDVAEQNAGSMKINVNANDGKNRLSKTITVTISSTSKQFNTSAPKVIVSGKNISSASRYDELTVQVFDRTPTDEITLLVTLNGEADEYTMKANSSKRVTLAEGKNTYKINARDLAGNMSNVVEGEFYYLPGPLEIEINEPGQNPYIIDDLPPSPPPDPRAYIKVEIEIEIDDQIGTVPETILYARIKGFGQDIQLYKQPNYIYTGNVKVTRGKNIFTIEVEDIAGNRKTETLIITIAE
jgi:hypothetical protein